MLLSPGSGVSAFAPAALALAGAPWPAQHTGLPRARLTGSQVRSLLSDQRGGLYVLAAVLWRRERESLSLVLWALRLSFDPWFAYLPLLYHNPNWLLLLEVDFQPKPPTALAPALLLTRYGVPWTCPGFHWKAK